jgi:asparagine synthase (glutamine-hydrolysing)
MTALSPDFLDSLAYGEHARSLGHDIVRDVPRSGPERRWSMLHLEDRYDRLAYLRGVMPHEMLDPYTDRRLVEFTLGVPEAQYRRAGVRRWLARRALADRLPAALLDQKGRGRQVGEWYHLASLRREATAEAVERLARSPLASRVLDVTYLKKLVDTWPADADSAIRTERQHRYVLHYSVTVGAFLRWHEGDHG